MARAVGVVHSMLRQPAIHTKTRTGLTICSVSLQSLQFQANWTHCMAQRPLRPGGRGGAMETLVPQGNKQWLRRRLAGIEGNR